jgi:hypothetical protein
VCAGAARGRWPPHGRPGPPRHAGVALGAPRHLSPLRAYKGALSRGPGEGASVGLGVWEASLEGTKWLACHGRWRVVLQKGALTVPICRPRPQPLPLAPGVQGKLARSGGFPSNCHAVIWVGNAASKGRTSCANSSRVRLVTSRNSLGRDCRAVNRRPGIESASFHRRRSIPSIGMHAEGTRG